MCLEYNLYIKNILYSSKIHCIHLKYTVFTQNTLYSPRIHCIFLEYTVFIQNTLYSPRIHCIDPEYTVFIQNMHCIHPEYTVFIQNTLYSSRINCIPPKYIVFPRRRGGWRTVSMRIQFLKEKTIFLTQYRNRRGYYPTIVRLKDIQIEGGSGGGGKGDETGDKNNLTIQLNFKLSD